MNLQDQAWIQALAQRLSATDIDHLELAGPALTLRLVRGPGGAFDAQVVPTGTPPVDSTLQGPSSAEAGLMLRAGSVGRVCLAHPLRDEPLVQAGDPVVAGQPLLLLQVGQVLLPVTAPCVGRVRRVVAQAGAAVGYGSPLVELDPA